MKCEICFHKKTELEYLMYGNIIKTCCDCWDIVYDNDMVFPNYLPKEQRKRYLLKKITKL